MNRFLGLLFTPTMVHMAQTPHPVLLRHTLNGLTLDLPSHLMGRELQAGFLILERGAEDQRTPITLTLLRQVGSTPPEGPWPNQIEAAGRKLHYREGQEEGGSGGMRRILEGWTPYPGGYVQVHASGPLEAPSNPCLTLATQGLAALRNPSPRL